MKTYLIITFGLLLPCWSLQAQDDRAAMLKAGQTVYTNYCISCHMSNGEGVPSVFPPLAKSDYLLEAPEHAIRAIKYGLQGEITVNGVTYDNYMAALGLSDQEVADVMNYILNSWGNETDEIVTVEQVKAIQKTE